MNLTDADALTLTNALPQLAKEDQERAKPLLEGYVKAKREAGLEPFQPAPAEVRATRQRQRASFAGLDKLPETLGTEKSAALDAATSGAIDPAGMKARVLVEQHVADTVTGLPEGWNGIGWEATKSAYAKQALGVDKPAVGDTELYGLIGKKFQADEDEESMWTERVGYLAKAAAEGVPFGDAWKDMALGVGLDARWQKDKHDMRRDQFRGFYQTLTTKAAEMAPMVQRSVDLLEFYGGTASPSRAVGNTQPLEELVNDIAAMPREEWGMLAAMIQAQAKPKAGEQEAPKEGGQLAAFGRDVVALVTTGKAPVRAARDVVDFVADVVDMDQAAAERNARIAKMTPEQMTAAGGLRVMPNGDILPANSTYGRVLVSQLGLPEPTPAQLEAFKAKAEQDTKRIDAAQFVNDIANGVVNPRKFESFVADALASAPGMVAPTVASMIPYAGPALVMNAAYNREMREARGRGVAWGDTSELALGAAAVQTALERMVSAKLLLGTSEVLTKVATKPLTRQTAGEVAGRAGVLFATGYAAEFATEASQDMMGMVFQTIASRLNPDIPAATMEDLQAYGATLPATAIALLPITLIGAGNAAFKDQAFGRQYLSDERVLMAAGFTKEATADILSAPTQAEATAKVQALWNDETKRQVETAAQREAVAAMEEEAKAQAAALKQGARIEQTPDGTYAVYSPTGQYIDEADTEEAALMLKEDADVALRATDEQRVRDMIDYFEARGGGGTIYDPAKVQRLHDRIGMAKKNGGMTEQEANDLVALYVKMGELSPTATPKTVAIHGASERVYDAKREVYDYVETLWKGANPLTLVEEKGESHVKRAMDAGKLTVAQIEGWQDTMEGAQDRAGMDEETRWRASVEFFSRSAKAYFLGRANESKDIPLSFRVILDQLRKFFERLMEFAARMIEMEDAGTLPTDFRTHLRQALRLDDDFVMGQMRDKERTQAEQDGGQDAGSELMATVRRNGGLLAASMEDVLAGELRNIAENMTTGERLRTFRKAGLDLDRLREALEGEGFVYDTPAAMLDAMERSTRGEPQYPTRLGETFSLAQTETPAFKAWFKDSKVVDAQGRPLVVFPDAGELIIEKEGYDGFIFEDTEMGGTTYVPFESEQVKSVGNRGSFDPKNPDITASLADADFSDRLEKHLKQRRVAMRVENDPEYSAEVRKAAEAMTYNVRARKTGDQEAVKLVTENNGDAAKLRVLIADRGNGYHPDTKTALTQLLMKAANARGDFGAVNDLLELWAPIATEAGQFIEGLKRFVVLDTPEGAQAYFKRKTDKANKEKPEGEKPIPGATEEQNAELARRARNIASTPEGSNERVVQTVELFNYVHEQLRPYDWVDLGVGLWYSGVLSSIITQGRNVGGNMAFMAFDVGEMVSTQLLTNPGRLMEFIREVGGGAVDGAKIGAGQAVAQVAEGRRSPLQNQDANVERGAGVMESKSKVLGPRAVVRPMEESRKVGKYVSRVMSATDATFQASSYELYSRHLAMKMVDERVKAGTVKAEDAALEVDRLLNATAEQVANHAAQAAAEWDQLTDDVQATTTRDRWLKNRAGELRQMDRDGELVEAASGMARRATFQYRPEGMIGLVALGIESAFGRAARYAEAMPAGSKKATAAKAAAAWVRINTVPFIRTPANVFNRGLDYGPVGLVRAMFDAVGVPVMVPGGEDYQRTADEKRRVLMRGIYGTVAMAALALRTMPPGPEDDEKDTPWLQVHGRGSGNMDRNRAQNGKAWKPFSLEIRTGGRTTFIDFRLMPVAPYLAAIGQLHDRRRYGKDRDTGAAQEAYLLGQGMMTAALSQSPMTALQELVSATAEDQPTSERAIANVVARGTAGQAANLIPLAGFFRSLDSLAGGDRKARNDMRAAMLAQLPFGSRFNEATVDALGEPLQNRAGVGWLADWQANDGPSARIYQVWADRDVMPSGLTRYRKELGGQFYEFSVERGRILKRLLLEDGEERLSRLAGMSDQLDEDGRSPARAYMASLSRLATLRALRSLEIEPDAKAE